jgi:hypothetical protein
MVGVNANIFTKNLQNQGPDAVAAAIEFYFPMYEMARTRYQALFNPNRLETNRFRHRRQLADHTHRNVTTPNNDTLYSAAWLNLADGPVLLTLPSIEKRYWSIALMDMFTNNFEIFGDRTHGNQPAKVLLLGPTWLGEPTEEFETIRSPCNDVWALVRILVRDLDDLPQVHAIQNAISAVQINGSHTASLPRWNATGPLTAENFVNVVAETLLNGNTCDRGYLSPSLNAWESLSNLRRLLWTERFEGSLKRIRDQHSMSRQTVLGWNYPALIFGTSGRVAKVPGNIGYFGQNYALRAEVALSELGALPPDEALYLSRQVDQNGEPLIGTHRYAVQFPQTNWGALSFWSLSIYEQNEDGRFYFADNPLKRYAIGDRFRDLVVNADSSLSLQIQHAKPAEQSNWLPAPIGHFQLVLRAYHPNQALLQGTAPLPEVIRVG